MTPSFPEVRTANAVDPVRDTAANDARVDVPNSPRQVCLTVESDACAMRGVRDWQTEPV